MTAPIRLTDEQRTVGDDEARALDLAKTVFGWQHLARYSGQTSEWLDTTLLAIVRSALAAVSCTPSPSVEAAERALVERVEAVLDAWADYESGDGPRPEGDCLQDEVLAALAPSSTENREPRSEHAAFYAKHYSTWKVHELDLKVYVPTATDRTELDALTLVQEILTEAAFDIRIATDDRTDER